MIKRNLCKQSFVRKDIPEVLYELARQVHNPDAVLPAGVLGPGEHIVGGPQLSHAPIYRQNHRRRII